MTRFADEYERRKAAQALGQGYGIDVYFWMALGGTATVIALFFGGMQSPKPNQSPAITEQEPSGQTQTLSLSLVGTNFEKSLQFILAVEGSCSDHPSDHGGSTCQGITASVAAQHGYSPDEVTEEIAAEIYREDYWEGVCDDLEFPASMACFNASVNSGPGRAKAFLSQLDRSQSARDQALSLVDMQDQYYQNIINGDPSQAVFERGWSNRSRKLRAWIAGVD